MSNISHKSPAFYRKKQLMQRTTFPCMKSSQLPSVEKEEDADNRSSSFGYSSQFSGWPPQLGTHCGPSNFTISCMALVKMCIMMPLKVCMSSIWNCFLRRRPHPPLPLGSGQAVGNARFRNRHDLLLHPSGLTSPQADHWRPHG